ncbi:MAG: TraB/GumN family protein [Thermoplasmatota archaeon]
MAPPALTLIGTGHVFQLEAAVRDAILALAPDVVFVELDAGRLQGLEERRRTGAEPEGGGFVARRLQAMQKALAEQYGAQAGGDMLAAVEGARLVGARVELIDPPATETLARVQNEMGAWERPRAAADAMRMVAGAGLSRLWPPARRRADQRLQEQVEAIQRDPAAAMEEMRKTLPSVYRVVIVERDAIMADRIRRGLAGARHGVAVLGDGHLPGVTAHLLDLKPATYRLAAVREGALPRPLVARSQPGETGRVSFTLDVRAGP